MPVHFIDNYPKNDLGTKICKQDGTPLYGEIWVYQELLKFTENGYLKDEVWYVKHNYNLSVHPSSGGKVEGQIDYLILSKYGILIIEVKGGGVVVDGNDTYYSYNLKDRQDRYEIQNPFVQVKEYVHTLKKLIDSNPFIYRAVIFPHESRFELIGPQLMGYKYLFFSKRNLDLKESDFGKNGLFFGFLCQLAKDARKNIISQLNPELTKARLEERIWDKFPLLSRNELDRLRSELFPLQNTYGFDPDKIKKDLILEENYEILKGLRKNRRVMVQGAPGTGKTVLATKFLAENVIKQHKGIYFCANRLLRAKMEYLIHDEYKIDSNLVKFSIYYQGLDVGSIPRDLDFLIVDEAQEFFDKGLFEFLEALDQMLESPRVLILYDPEQSIIQDSKEIDWYADYFMESGFVHYLFDTVWRCAQSENISVAAGHVMSGMYTKVLKSCSKDIMEVSDVISKLKALKDVIDKARNEHREYIILVQSKILEDFKQVAEDFFKDELLELSDKNVNARYQKLMYTTPIKFRGLECENVILITPGFSDGTKVENFIAMTRAIYKLSFIIWN